MPTLAMEPLPKKGIRIAIDVPYPLPVPRACPVFISRVSKSADYFYRPHSVAALLRTV